MNYQYGYAASCTILQEKGISQKDLSEKLKKLDITGHSEGNLSRAKPRFDREKRVWLRGSLPDGQLKELLKGIKQVLEEVHVKLEIENGRFVFYDLNRMVQYDIPECEYVDSNAPVADENGIIKIYKTLLQNELIEKLKKAKQIRLIQTFMSHTGQFADAFSECLKGGGQIQMMLIDPDGYGARLRTKGLSNLQAKGNVRKRVYDSLEEVYSQLDVKNGSMEIRFYDEIPGMELYAYDDRLLVGFLWFGKYASSGSYIELVNDDRYSLVKNINEHWEELWRKGYYPTIFGNSPQSLGAQTLNYKCHFLRKGKFECFELHLDMLNRTVLVDHTESGFAFRGRLEEARGRYISVFAETANIFTDGKLEEVNKRIVHLLIYTGNDRFERNQILIGAYISLSPNNRLYSNLVVLERMEESYEPDKAHLKIIYKLLERTESRIDHIDFQDIKGLTAYLDDRDPNRVRKETLLHHLIGAYDIYYKYTDLEGKYCVARRPLEVLANGKVVKKDYQGTLRDDFQLVALDDKHVLVQRQTNTGMGTCFFLGRISNTKNYNKIRGVLIGVSSKNDIVVSTIICQKRSNGLSSTPEDWDAEDEFTLKRLQKEGIEL